MALDPSTNVPNTDNASPAYPYGSARNVSTPTSTDGTPYLENWLNDIWGFLQSILDDQGEIPNGNPDSVSNQQYLDAVKGIIVDVVTPLIPVIPPISPDTTFATVADMIADADDVLTPGLSAMTLGYNSVGDGGAGVYAIVPNGSGTADGGLFINLPNSTGNPQANLLNNGFVYPEQYGAPATVSSDSTAQILAALQAVGSVRLNSDKVYGVTGVDASAINGVRIFGYGKLNLLAGSNTDALIVGEDATIEDITIDANGNNQSTGANLAAGHDLHLYGVRLIDGKDQCLRVEEGNPTKGAIITNCTMAGADNAIKLVNMENVSINNCQFRTINQEYIEIEASSVSSVEIDGIIVNGCAFSVVRDIFKLTEIGLATVGTNIKAQACVFDGGPDDSFDILDAKNDIRAVVGTGTPEGSIAAGVGSTYRRRNGGPGTTFYLKELGSGNTGWRALELPVNVVVPDSSQVAFNIYNPGVTTINPPNNAVSGTLIAIGGGGSGANSENDNRSGGGGGGGATSITIWKPSDGQLSVQIGTGGPQQPANGQPGFAGQETWIDNADGTRIATAGAGQGGFDPQSGAGGAGGVASDGLRNSNGSTGGPGLAAGGSGSAGGPGGQINGIHPFVGNALRITFSNFGKGGNGSEQTENPPPQPGQDGRILAFWSLTR